LRRKRWGLPELVAIVGGFLILSGMILLGIAILSLFGYFDVGILLERKYLLVFAIAMIAVGLFDALSAITIARW